MSRPIDPRDRNAWGARAVYGAPPPPKRPCDVCGEKHASLCTPDGRKERVCIGCLMLVHRLEDLFAEIGRFARRAEVAELVDTVSHYMHTPAESEPFEIYIAMGDCAREALERLAALALEERN